MKILHVCRTTLENKITFLKKCPSRLRVKGAPIITEFHPYLTGLPHWHRCSCTIIIASKATMKKISTNSCLGRIYIYIYCIITTKENN